MKKFYRKVTSIFNGLWPFEQKIHFQNSKGKYESMKILDFAKKMRKSDIFEFFEFFCEDG
jgi:hypothetical protein